MSRQPQRRHPLGPDAPERLALDALADTGLTRTDLAVLVAYACRAREDTGEAWPGNALVARAVGASVREVRRARARLIERGYLRQTGFNQNRRVFEIVTLETAAPEARAEGGRTGSALGGEGADVDPHEGGPTGSGQGGRTRSAQNGQGNDTPPSPPHADAVNQAASPVGDSFTRARHVNGRATSAPSGAKSPGNGRQAAGPGVSGRQPPATCVVCGATATGRTPDGASYCNRTDHYTRAVIGKY